MSESWAAVKSEVPVPSGDGHVGVWPLDEHNVKLLDRVHPRGWANPEKPADFVYDLVAIGGGAAGLISAKQTARRGGTSALIEQHLAGGDCLNVGCVPSKALLRCARAAQERRRSDLGALPLDPKVEFGKVMERMRKLRSDIADVDAHTATQAAGADMYNGKGVFKGPNEIQVGDKVLKFRKAVICTGGRATVPPIPGLRESPHLTNSTLFNLTALPPRFVVIGAGPIGLEMAQSFRRFGSEVTVMEAMPRILGPEDPEASAVLHRVLTEEGCRVIAAAGISKVEHSDPSGGSQWPEIRISCAPDGKAETIVCDALLVATGRAANVDGIGLEKVGVETDRFGIVVKDDLSTTNPDIFAAGDCTNRPALRFTHTAGGMASVAITNSLFGGRGPPVLAPSTKISEIVVPRCTYTEPEVASCGLGNLEQAERAGVEVDVYSFSLDHVDRRILEGDALGGFCKVLCKKGTDTIVGGVIVAERAGDMLAEITFAAQHGIGLAKIGHTIHPYPTMGEGVQQCGLQFIRKSWERVETKSSPETTPASSPVPDKAVTTKPGKTLNFSVGGLNALLGKSEGRDKLSRFFQYLARFLKSYLETQVKPGAGTPLKHLQDMSADVTKTLGGARRTFRFGKEIPVIQSLPATFAEEMSIDKVLELGRKFSQIAYLLLDHMGWLKQNKVRRAGKRAGTGTIQWGMFFFMISNFAQGVIQYRKKNMKNVFKQLCLVQQCAHSSRTFETHDMLVGLSGMYTSYVDSVAQWPTK